MEDGGFQSLIVGGGVYVGQRMRVGDLDGGDVFLVASDQASSTFVTAGGSQFGKETAGKQGRCSGLSSVRGADNEEAGFLKAGHECLQQVGRDQRLIALEEERRLRPGRECGQSHLHRGAQSRFPTPVHHSLDRPRAQRGTSSLSLAAQHDDHRRQSCTQRYVGDVGQERHATPIEQLLGLAEAGGRARGQDDSGNLFHSTSVAWNKVPVKCQGLPSYSPRL